MHYDIYELILLFFTYSFAGWCLETAASSVIGRRFKNRGLVSCPFCLMYGLIGICTTIAFRELRGSVVILFFGSTVLAAFLQWLCGIYLERIGKGKWWDYSGLPLNINGYVAVPVSAFIGGAFTLAVLFLNDLLVGVFRLLPVTLRRIIVWSLLLICALDLAVSLLAFLRLRHKSPLIRFNSSVARASLHLSDRISGFVRSRVIKAYPDLAESLLAPQKTAASDISSGGGVSGFTNGEAESYDHLAPLDVFWIFVLGGLAGCLIEMVFMRLTRGAWVSRSSFVWGTFSSVWGGAIAMFSILLFKERARSDSFFFITGTLFGGVFEYLSSVFTQLFFGAIFWDYSRLPFNIAGRINLLYCFFWGIAAVIWTKKILPHVVLLFRPFRRGWGLILSWLLLIFMTGNIVFSSGALIRYNSRSMGNPPGNAASAYFDRFYDDTRMEKIYPYLKHRHF